LTIASQNM